MQGIALSSRIIIGIALLHAPPALGQVFWINEFHYDNTGTDLNEFVEIVASSDFTDLESLRLTLYNGDSGDPYGGSHLLSTFDKGSTVAGLTFYSKNLAALQNGPGDGMAIDHEGTVLQFLSYEGAFTANSGPAAGLLSIGVSVSESELTLAGASLGLTGIGEALNAFTWAEMTSATPGTANPGQIVVPEPYFITSAMVLLLAIFSAAHRITRHRRDGFQHLGPSSDVTGH
jgi:hypothetical protein